MASTKLKPIDAGEVQLGKLFTAEFDFTIPDYQRPYAWGRDEPLQLLDDLQGAVDRDTDEPYFLGSIVLVKRKGVAAAEVIDGQQRNSEAQNYDVAVKKAKYFTSTRGAAVFALTTQVLACDTWTPEVVARRQEELSTRLISEWNLN